MAKYIKANAVVQFLINEALDYHDGKPILGARTWARTGSSKFVAIKIYQMHLPMQIYNPVENSKRQFAFAPNKRRYRVAVENGLLYAMGGQINKKGELTNKMEIFNPRTRKWTEGEPMHNERMRHAATSTQGIIYVCGGVGPKNKPLKSMESYNTWTKKWTELAPLKEPRERHRIVAAGHYLYSIGGWLLGKNTRQINVYDILRNEWTDTLHMLRERNLFGAAHLNGKIYICGGYGYTQYAEVLDLATYEFAYITYPGGKKSFSLVPYNHRIWAFGGVNDNTVDVYNPDDDKWEIVGKIDSGPDGLETVLMHF